MKKSKDVLNRAFSRWRSKIGSSNVFASLVSENFLADSTCATQLGIAILLDKPIFLIVKKGTTLPTALVRAAQRIEFVDFENSVDMQRASDKLADFSREHE